MSDLTVTVKLRWDGEFLWARDLLCGVASDRGAEILQNPWAAVCHIGARSATWHPTEAEARAAVEAAAIKALGGHADE